MNTHRSDRVGEIKSHRLLRHGFQMGQCGECMAQVKVRELDQTKLPEARARAEELILQMNHHDYP